MTNDYYTISTRPATASADGVVTARVELAGSFDIGTRDELQDALLEVVEAGAGDRIIVDLGEVRFIDSEALSALIQGYLAAERAGIVLRLAKPVGIVARVINVIGLDHLLDSPAG